MTDTGIYSDIAVRTGGDIYIGVVGPVRTGKSTLIKRFTENLILPGIESESDRVRARDEMPQSASGRTVMTTEPKFIPENAARIPLDEGAECRVKLIDCVGYIVPGAMGLIEEGQPRMVMTPWSETPLPFEEAAETGTRKVIREHSTVGILVTTDGSIGELPRESYVDAEKRVVDELKEINKPFVIVLNSARPNGSEAVSLAERLEADYDVPVLALNCLEMGEEDIRDILRGLLYEFPVREINVSLPEWLGALGDDDTLKEKLFSDIRAGAAGIKRVGEIRESVAAFRSGDITAHTGTLNLGTGEADIALDVPNTLFYSVLAEKSGLEIEGELGLLSVITELADTKRKYDKVASAIDDVMNDGYGIVMPSVDDLTLEEPEIVKQPGGYGVKLKASAPSIHMMKADIETEVNPIVGTESQSEELVKFLLHEFEEDPKSIWESNMFGKTLHELVSEGLNSKLAHMPDSARMKIADTIRRIINEGSGGLICILL